MKTILEHIEDSKQINENSVKISKVRDQLEKEDREEFDDALKELKISKSASIDKKQAKTLGQHLLDEIGSSMDDAITFLEDEFELEFD